MKTRARRIAAAAFHATAAVLLTASTVRGIDNFDWKPALTGSQLWSLDGNWVQPDFPNSGAQGAVVAVPADLMLDVGPANADVAVALLTLEGTAAGADVNVTSSGARLIFQNDENNTSVEPDPASPDVDPILQNEGVNHGRVYVTSNGVTGSLNTISAPIRLNNNGFLEGVDFFGNQSITLSGPIDVVGTVAEDLGSLRSYLPAGTKLLITGDVNLTDGGDMATARVLALNNYFTTDHAEPPRGTIEISGTISGAGGPVVGWNWDVDGDFMVEEDWLYDPAPTPGLPLSTVILSGANTFTGEVVLSRGNLVIRHDNALGDPNEAVFLQGGQSGAKREVGYNLVVDAGDRTIANTLALTENLTFKGTASVEWSGVVYQNNGRTLINVLPFDLAAGAGETLTFSGAVHANRKGENPPDPGRILTFDGTGKTIISGGLHDQFVTGEEPPETEDRIGYLAKQGTGTLVIDGRVFDGMGNQIGYNDTDYGGYTFVNGGNLRYHSSDDLGFGAIMSYTGAVGVGSGVVANSDFLGRFNNSSNPNHPQDISPFFLTYDVSTPIFTTFSTGGLMLGDAEYGENLDFSGTQDANPLARAANMTLAAQAGGSTYTGTITPSSTAATNPNTYQLGGGIGALTVPNANQLTGARNLLVTNGGEVRLQGVNNYTGSTRVVARFAESLEELAAADSGDPNNDGNYADTSTQIRIGSTLTVSNLGNGGTNSSIGSSSNAAANLLVHGSTLKYVGGATSTDRLFTVGTAGAAIDSSGSGAISFTNSAALAIDTAENRPGFIAVGVVGSANHEIFGRPALGVPFSTENLMPGMRIQGISGTSGFVAGLKIESISAIDAVTVGGVTSWQGFTVTGQRTIDFGPAPRRMLMLAGSNSGDNTLAPLVGNASDTGEATAAETAAGYGTVGITKSGAGKWILIGNNTYSGPTNVEAGTLLVNGTQTGAGLTTVSSGASFGGTGQIGGGLTLLEGAAYTAAFAAGTIDPLNVLGNLDLSALGNILNVTGTGVGTSWTLLTYVGTLTGEFESTPGYTVNYGTGANSLITITAAGGPIGDYNNDGTVNAADYTLWRDNLGAAGATLGSNRDPANGLGVVTIADYNSWKAHFGETGAGSGGLAGNAAVPEPASWLLALAGVLGATIVLKRGVFMFDNSRCDF